MKMQLMSAVALVFASTSLAQAAAVTPEQLAAQYKADGYTRIEVDFSQTRAQVEAIKDGVKLEVLHDLSTGQILKQETERVAGDDDVSPGVFVRQDDRDDDHGGDRDDNDDHDDHGQGDDNGGHGDDSGGHGRGDD